MHFMKLDQNTELFSSCVAVGHFKKRVLEITGFLCEKVKVCNQILLLLTAPLLGYKLQNKTLK